MASWLLKTEPDTYSFSDLARSGNTVWDGVSNPLALKYLRTMKKGDHVFIYHTGHQKAVVGIAEITGGPFADPKKNDPKLAVVNIRALKSLQRPVSLAEIKSQRSLSSFDLVRLPRLSVMPVSAEQWDCILKLSQQKTPS